MLGAARQAHVSHPDCSTPSLSNMLSHLHHGWPSFEEGLRKPQRKGDQSSSFTLQNHTSVSRSRCALSIPLCYFRILKFWKPSNHNSDAFHFLSPFLPPAEVEFPLSGCLSLSGLP